MRRRPVTSGSASTAITVSDVDYAPVVTAPPAVSVSEANPLAVSVHASDPDGHPLTSLVADLSGLPPGATFTAAGDDQDVENGLRRPGGGGLVLFADDALHHVAAQLHPPIHDVIDEPVAVSSQFLGGANVVSPRAS